jgi:hypothetical protein
LNANAKIPVVCAAHRDDGTLIALSFYERTSIFDFNISQQSKQGGKRMEIAKEQGVRATRDLILSMVASRPHSVKQITHAFSARSYEVVKLLSDMVRKGQVEVKSTNEGLFVVGANTHL